MLLHVERASSLRQDLYTEGSMDILMKYLYYIEFLDRSLHRRKKSSKTSILQLNLSSAFTLSEMLALVCPLLILHIYVYMLIHRLDGKTQHLKKHNQWGPRSMCQVVDTLDASTALVVKSTKIILTRTS